MEEENTKEIEILESKPMNEIVEIDENEEITNTQYDMEKVSENPSKKEKKPSGWSKLSKKKKIIIIVSIVIILLVIVGILLYFLVFKKDNHKDDYKEPTVVIEKDNYKYEDGKLIFIDNDKKEIGEYECTNKNENLCYVAYFSNEDTFDINKKVYENGGLVNIRTDIIDNYVFIYDDETKEKGEVSLYDMKEKKIIDTYSLVKKVKDKYVILKKDGNYNLINLDKKVSKVIDTSYDYMGYIEDTNNLVVATNNNYKLINFDGDSVSKNVPGTIMNFDANNISVKVNNNYFVYNYNGEVVVNKEYNYIRFVNNYIIAAEGKKLFVYDVNGNPMNLDGIRITSSDYNTKLVFNDNLRQTGKEEAFNVVVTNNTMRIEYGEDYTKINLSDGVVSKNISYISYFGGKLYFYSDEEKTNLIGTYKCEYANDTNEATKELENCFIAKESNIFLSDNKDVKNGYLPIYNNTYVFIADTKSPKSNDNIILWDLKSNKKLATYKSVDAGFHDTEKTVNFITTAGTLVVAKNTSDSYGLINILTKDVKGLIPFKDENDNKITNVSFKSLNDNFLIKRSDDTYHLYNKKGVELASKVSTKYEIVEYSNNHLKVKNNDKYLIYDLNGKVVSDEFKYIAMESNFYIAIDGSNFLHVYKYDSKNDLMSEELEIKDIDKDLNYEIKNDLLIITNPEDVGSTIKVTIS